MQYFHNIEKSTFPGRQYVGYAHGVWEISGESGNWEAVRRDKIPGGVNYIRGTRLSVISSELEKVLA